MIEAILTIIVAIAVAAGIYYFLKKASTLIINSIIGLVTLFLLNQFDFLGIGQIPITWATVIVCALGGLPGAVLVVILHLVGISI
ncbi:MAG: hypothetical protein APR53_10400 [Methanoculleus sp. SDB]|nr:MAG: hypothetical protein APR53_10400 [Methanoculleus sp. SDB]